MLAVIPARGGSRALPGKNLRHIAGRTLVGRAVDAARQAALVNRTIGSTDDPAIADEMRAAGAEVLSLRPAALALDLVPDAPVFLQVLDELLEKGYEPDVVVNVRPTAPLRTGADIDGAVRLLLGNTGATSVKSVSAVKEHPYKMWTLRDDGVLEPVTPHWRVLYDNDPDVPRQQLPDTYRSNGAVDAVRVAALRATGRFHPGPVLAYVMPAARAVDVDDEQDLAAAAAYLAAAT